MRLSRETTNLYKGLGILLIVLHNYFHNIPPLIGQNEFYFNSQVTTRFIDAMLASPTEWVRAVFSYLAHYGVQLFIFLSAYGLTKKYADETIRYTVFLKSRFSKIYISFVICVVVYVSLAILKSAFLTDEKVLFWDSLLWKLLLVSNVMPGEAIRPVGPWWFLPFILQFYLVFPLLLLIYRSKGVLFLVLLSLAAMVLEWTVNPWLNSMGINLNYIFIGHLPVFCLGIYLADNPEARVTIGPVILAFVIFILGCINSVAWIASDLCVTVLLLVLSGWYISKLSPASISYRVIGYYGVISFHLFMVNGFLRGPFHSAAVSLDKWWLTIVCGMLSLLFSTVFAVVLRKIDYKIRDVVHCGYIAACK